MVDAATSAVQLGAAVTVAGDGRPALLISASTAPDVGIPTLLHAEIRTVELPEEG